LFLDGSKTGQKIVVQVTRQFRTFAPVDIHRLVHRGVGFLLAGAFLRRGHVTQGRQAAWSTPLCEQKCQRDRSRKIFLHSDGLDDGFQEAVNAAAANVVGT